VNNLIVSYYPKHCRQENEIFIEFRVSFNGQFDSSGSK